MKLAALLLFWVTAVAQAGLGHYAQMVVADPAASKVPTLGVRITYLGVNGYLLESDETKLLIDPYFTRWNLLSVALNLRQDPDARDLEWAKARLPHHVDAILVTHGHFDHLLDVPPLSRDLGARVIASTSSTYIARAAKAASTQAAQPGMQFQVRAAKISVLPASHDCVFGRVPFPGDRDEIPPPPRRPSDWVCGEPLAFLIEMGGQRIYIDSGGTSAVLPPKNLGRVDLAIIGVALPDSRARLPEMLRRLRPVFFLPTHQDHFFRPVQRGFVFGPMTDFPQVRRLATGHRTILLDYFRPWTLR